MPLINPTSTILEFNVADTPRYRRINDSGLKGDSYVFRDESDGYESLIFLYMSLFSSQH